MRLKTLVAVAVAAAFAVPLSTHAQSDKPSSGYDFATVVEDVRQFIEALELDRPVVAGHSWGGNVALELAARHPEHAAGLVLVDGGFMEMSARPGMTPWAGRRSAATLSRSTGRPPPRAWRRRGRR